MKGRFEPETVERIFAENEILQEQAKNEKISKKLLHMKVRLADKEQQLANKEQQLANKEQQLADKEKYLASERSTSVNAAENIANMSDEERKENFELKKKLMEEHPIMLEPCLNSMCKSYVATKDETMKKEMLGDLYEVRKGGNTDVDNRDMAKTFKRVLDKNPSLKNDENLVALSKIDTVISQPTKVVKKQVEHLK